MKVACVQMNIVFGEPEKNYEVVEKYIEEAVKAHADTIVLPELWNTGYALERLAELADEDGEKTKAFFARLAEKHNVNIIGGSVATKVGNDFFNTMYVINRTGTIIAEYNKAHLFKLMDEHLFMKAGQKANLFDIDGITCGGVICYDLRFPEWLRVHALQGAKIIFIPAQWPKQRIDHWQILVRARAIENQCFIIAVNRIGSDANNEFNGHSMVIAPWGDMLVGNESEQGIYYADLNVQEADRVRQTIPVFQDRRVDLYKFN